MKQKRWLSLAVLLLLAACGDKTTSEEKEVPTTLEQHDSGVSSSSSFSSGQGQSSTSATSTTSNGGAPTSFSFSTISQTDTILLSSIRDLADNKELRDELEKEALKLLLEDGLISAASDKVNLTITNEWVMVNKKVLENDQAKKYMDLLRSKMSLGEVFNYSFNQY